MAAILIRAGYLPQFTAYPGIAQPKLAKKTASRPAASDFVAFLTRKNGAMGMIARVICPVIKIISFMLVRVIEASTAART